MAVFEITKKEFEKESKKDTNIILKFTAEWCAPCKYLAPIFKEVSEEIDSDFYEVDVDKNTELAQEFSILSVPTIVITRKGHEISRINGAMPKESLKNKILSSIG